MKTWKRRLSLILSVLLAATVLASCTAETIDTPVAPDTGESQSGGEEASPSDEGTGGTVSQFDRSETVYIFSGMSVTPSSFNPLDGDPGWPLGNRRDVELVYETLFMMNMITGDLEPLVGESYEFDGLDVKIKIHENVTFNDGTPLTSADVKYSYELGEKYDIHWSDYWLYLDSIEIVDDYNLIFHQKSDNPNPLSMLDSLQGVYMLPKHIWEKVEEDNGNDIAAIRRNWTQLEPENFPIATGSYKVHSFNDQMTVIERNDNYWGVALFGGLPSAKYICNPLYNSNDILALAFQNGEVDLAQAFIPKIWEMMDSNPAIMTYLDDFPYHLEGTMVGVMFNNTRPGLDNPEVRRAIAHAINYEQIAEAAMSRYTKTLVPMLALNNGVEDEYVDVDSLRELMYSYDIDTANAILDEMGAEPGADGIRVLPDGTRMSWTIQTGYGWSDWNAAAEVIAQSTKAIGVEILSEMPEGAQFISNRQVGDFDLALTIPGEGMLPSQPWYRYKWIMSDESMAPIGEMAFSNEMRYSNARATEIVNQIPQTTDEATLRELHTELNRIYLEDLPMVMLMYRPYQFYEVNQTHWTGWPSQENDLPPMIDRLAGLRTFFEIQPVA